jgi:hypothetical protein
MQRRAATVLLFGMLTMLSVGLLAVPASAEITKGTCSGSATFPDKETDKVLDAARPRSSVFEAPLGATVMYAGSLGPGAEKSDDPIPFKGGVSLRIPRMSIPIASWEGDTEEVSDAGTYTYDLPDFVPQGTGGLEVTAWHNHTGFPDCEAVATVTILGDPGAAAVVAGGLTALAGVGTVAAGRAKKP